MLFLAGILLRNILKMMATTERSLAEIPTELKTVNGKKYTLAQNDGNNNLHGGIYGFDKKTCDYEITDGAGYKLFAYAKGEKTGICMDCYTNLSGVQLYTGNMINNNRVCKDGAI